MEGNFRLDQAQLLQRNHNAQGRYEQWSIIVSQISARGLAYDSDWLPALSGVASHIYIPEMVRYLAGLWEGSLPHALLWLA